MSQGSRTAADEPIGRGELLGGRTGDRRPFRSAGFAVVLGDVGARPACLSLGSLLEVGGPRCASPANDSGSGAVSGGATLKPIGHLRLPSAGVAAGRRVRDGILAGEG
jgi:hypothetical protein